MPSPVGIAKNLVEAARHVLSQSLICRHRRKSFDFCGKPFVHTTPDGTQFELYPGEFVDRDVYAFGAYERHFLDLLKSRLKGGRSFLDVGANIGNHALALRGVFDQVHCFEPNPIILERLRRNIALNAAGNVFVHPVGLGAANADLPFMQDLTGNMARGSFVYEGDAEPILLPVVNGSQYIGQHGITGIDFIKVDVEGSEPEVFRGLREVIAAHRPIVAFEYHGHLEPIETWQAIVASLPGYVFAEAIPPAPAGALAKLAFAVRHGTQPPPAALDSPGERSYAAIFGFPSREAFADFLA